MKQYINKSAVVAEIERLAEVGRNNASCFDEYRKEKAVWLQQADVCDRILSFLNSLEVKEVDLEEKATQLSQKYFPDEENIWARSNIEAQKCKSACIEMVECLKAQKGE